MKPLLAITVLGVTAVIGAWTRAQAIEQQLATDVEQALRLGRFERVAVTVDGRHVVLEGRVADVAQRQRVEAVMAAIDGVAAVNNRLTLAVVPATAPPPPSVTTVAVDRESCQARLDRLLEGAGIDFESSSAELTPGGADVLAQAARELERCASLRVEIGGHTDASGPRDENLTLSLRRAEAVLAGLVAQGIARERLTAVGHGPDRPIVSNETPEGRAVNRRIELLVEDADG